MPNRFCGTPSNHRLAGRPATDSEVGSRAGPSRCPSSCARSIASTTAGWSLDPAGTLRPGANRSSGRTSLGHAASEKADDGGLCRSLARADHRWDNESGGQYFLNYNECYNDEDPSIWSCKGQRFGDPPCISIGSRYLKKLATASDKRKSTGRSPSGWRSWPMMSWTNRRGCRRGPCRGICWRGATGCWSSIVRASTSAPGETPDSDRVACCRSKWTR